MIRDWWKSHWEWWKCSQRCQQALVQILGELAEYCKPFLTCAVDTTAHANLYDRYTEKNQWRKNHSLVHPGPPEIFCSKEGKSQVICKETLHKRDCVGGEGPGYPIVFIHLALNSHWIKCGNSIGERDQSPGLPPSRVFPPPPCNTESRSLLSAFLPAPQLFPSWLHNRFNKKALSRGLVLMALC